MRKFISSSLAIFAFAGFLSAQDGCMALFPNDKGTTWETKCYNSGDQLVGSTKYMVKDYSEMPSGPNTEIVFTVMNANGEVQNQGEMEAYCNEGDFYVKSESHPVNSDITSMISSNVNLLGSFLNYPNTFNMNDPFDMEGGEFTIKPKADKKDFVRVRIHNRSFEKNEKVTTPAGTFDASKISYEVEVYDNANKKTMNYKNVEWYAVGAGIVRAEAYDSNNKMDNYTVLASLDANN